MKIKEFWPEWLKDAVWSYLEDDPRRKKQKRGIRDRMETRNDFYDLDQLKPEDIPLLNECFMAMADVYEGNESSRKYFSPEVWAKYSLRTFPRPIGEVDPPPHISTFLHKMEPFKSVRLKYPHLYKTLIIWTWD